MNINIELYKTFFCVAKNKNITKAAKELLITQPAVSKSIKTLEEQIGCPLFIRSKKGVVLTEEGKVFYEQISKAMEIIATAEEKIQEIVSLDYGYLNIGVSNTLVKKFLLPYLEKFHKMYPKIKISIDTNPTYELINRVRNGVVDLIIINMPAKLPNDFIQFKLKEVHDMFVANNSFKELKNKVIPLKDLSKYPLILMAKNSNTRDFLDKYLESKGITLNPEIELTSYSLVTEFTKIGMGIGVVTKEYLNNELEDGTLFEVKTDPHLEKRYVGYDYLKKKELSRSTLKFLEILNNNIIKK